MEVESCQTRETVKDMQLLETSTTERESPIPETTTNECLNSTITRECCKHMIIDECQHSKKTNEHLNNRDQMERGCPSNRFQTTRGHRHITTKPIIKPTPTSSRQHRQTPALFLLQFIGNVAIHLCMYSCYP